MYTRRFSSNPPIFSDKFFRLIWYSGLSTVMRHICEPLARDSASRGIITAVLPSPMFIWKENENCHRNSKQKLRTPTVNLLASGYSSHHQGIPFDVQLLSESDESVDRFQFRIVTIQDDLSDSSWCGQCYWIPFSFPAS